MSTERQSCEVTLPDGRRFDCQVDVEFGERDEYNRVPYGMGHTTEVITLRTIESVTLISAQQLVEIGDARTLDLIERRVERDLRAEYAND